MDNERQHSEAVSYSNQNFQDFSALKIRLDTKQLIEEIKLNLSGKILQPFEKSDGTLGLREETIGEARANRQGIQSIVSFLNSHINIPTVQGNYIDDEMYFLNVDDIEDSLREMLIINSPYWDIKDENISSIYHEVLKAVTDFKTRLLYNKERDSYGETMRTVENNTVQSNKGGFGLYKS